MFAFASADPIAASAEDLKDTVAETPCKAEMIN
jgi:hypothetical protein